MEVRVLVHGLLPVAELGLVALEDRGHVRKLFGGGVLRGAGGQPRLDHPAHVQKLGDQLPLARQHQGEGHHQRVRGEIAHHRAVTLPGLEDPHHLQRAHGVADRAAADAQLRHQLALGRKKVARLQRALGDHAADLLGDLLVAADLADRLEPAGDRRSAAGGHWSDLSEI